MANSTADALRATLISPNECDSNFEAANVVDVVASLARATRSVSRPITPADAAPGRDAAGGAVTSLTEAVMGVTSGLCRIADAIERLAEAVELKGSPE